MPTWDFKCDNGDLLRQAALDHGGIVSLPEFFVEGDLATGRLVEVFPNDGTDDQPIRLVYPHRQYLPRKVRVFSDYLAECLQ